jgi:hypothetical protein
MTLRYGTPDTPAPNRSVVERAPVTVKTSVEPAHPSNIVTVYYRIDMGQVRSFRAVPNNFGWEPGPQYFTATFPRLPRNSEVRYGAFASRAGLRVPKTGTAGALPYSFRYVGRENSGPRFQSTQSSAGNADISKEQNSRAPFELDFLCHVETQLAQKPEIIGQTPEGIRVHYFVSSGAVRGPQLNGTVSRQGGDWMTIRTDGVAIPDVRATIMTDDGALIYMRYKGVFELGKDGYQAFLRNKLPANPKLLIAPCFTTADQRYAWLNRHQCIGIGFVDTNRLSVRYDLYALC